MKKASTTIEVTHFIDCPHCYNDRYRVDHLFSPDKQVRHFGPWYCDECGGSFSGKVIGSDVFVEKHDESKRKDKCLVFLKNNNVMLVVKGMYFDGELNLENERYFYEEHTCPTNYLGVEMVIDTDDGDTDPHGIFEFIGAIPYVDLDYVDDINSIIPKTEANKK